MTNEDSEKLLREKVADASGAANGADDQISSRCSCWRRRSHE